MKTIALILMLAFSLTGYAKEPSAVTQGDDSIYGTHSVGFQPIQVGGELQGCSLVYKVVHADGVYLRGNPVAIIGNISIGQTGFELGLALKIGVQELVGNHQLVRPNFAYLQTKSYSTAKARQQSSDGEDGFSLFVYSLYDKSVMGLFDEMMDLRKVTIAFNRQKNGMDVLVPVDFDVTDADYLDGARVVRKRSKATKTNFMSCFATLLEQVQLSLDKK